MVQPAELTLTAPVSQNAQLVRQLALLWLAGIATRLTILAIPPVLPLIRDELQMTEAQVGFLVGLPVLMFALAAVPGSLLIARLGTRLTLISGIAITALAGAARGGAADIWQLAAATVLMGFGIAIVQPTLPAIVREWMPRRVGLGTVVYSNGMLTAVMLAPTLTIPVVLPLLDGSWRLDLVVWSMPVLATALLIALVRPQPAKGAAAMPATTRWWPNWRKPLIWLLGFTFGSNNAAYYGANAFLPDFLAGQGRADLIGPALGSLNAAQFAASLVLLVIANRLLRRALPYLVFGPLTTALAALTPRKRAVVALCCGAHCAVTTAQLRMSHSKNDVVVFIVRSTGFSRKFVTWREGFYQLPSEGVCRNNPS